MRFVCIHEHKIKIPDDLAFIGFDGGDCFDLFYSPITFVKQPIEEMGKDAVRILIDSINNNSNKNTQIVHKPELIIRNSC
ncbi:MAG: substrate-binding domain-containing protein [Bacteroidales bacterium]|nr:substrate-binding domain-containing protein [Bacteroidales bacterium]